MGKSSSFHPSPLENNVTLVWRMCFCYSPSTLLGFLCWGHYSHKIINHGHLTNLSSLYENDSGAKLNHSEMEGVWIGAEGHRQNINIKVKE